MYYERTLDPVIRKISETFPVLIVPGPWQVGKTTLLTRIGEGAVICMSEDLLPIDSKNWYVPAWLI